MTLFFSLLVPVVCWYEEEHDNITRMQVFVEKAEHYLFFLICLHCLLVFLFFSVSKFCLQEKRDRILVPTVC